MCGRITQHRKPQDYMQALDFPASISQHAAERQPSYNTPPGTTPLLIHAFDEAGPMIDTVRWGYRPNWAAEKGIPLAINARIEKAATGRYFRSMWLHGRVLVPADGWFEWTGKAGHKQPWYIRRKTDEPLFLAAITNVRPDRENAEGSGFVIVTAAADAGMVDIHDRRQWCWRRRMRACGWMRICRQSRRNNWRGRWRRQPMSSSGMRSARRSTGPATAART